MSNITTVRIILNYYYGEIVSGFNLQILIYVIIPFLITILINYFYLYKRRVNLDIKYKNETKAKRRLGSILVNGYILVSTFLLFYFLSKYSLPYHG
jgi:heme/copper-type cytochrome/quinol oxidase subunit 2